MALNEGLENFFIFESKAKLQQAQTAEERADNAGIRLLYNLKRLRKE